MCFLKSKVGRHVIKESKDLAESEARGVAISSLLQSCIASIGELISADLKLDVLRQKAKELASACEALGAASLDSCESGIKGAVLKIDTLFLDFSFRSVSMCAVALSSQGEGAGGIHRLDLPLLNSWFVLAIALLVF
jgi:hypothetical protein